MEDGEEAFLAGKKRVRLCGEKADHHQHHHTLLTLENAYTRAFTMILSVVLFSSVSAIALWALVERAFRKSRREVAMLPILCDYEKVQTLNEDKEETIKEQQ